MRVQFDHLRADRRTLAVIALAIAFFVQTAVRGDDRLLESPREPFTGFDAFVNEAIRGWEVPGLAIAVVKNGKTILARGYGYRDVAKKLPVTPTTIFAIVSCSKAFTTFMMGMLVDEGTLEWNRPVRTYLSEFHLYDRVATELITRATWSRIAPACRGTTCSGTTRRSQERSWSNGCPFSNRQRRSETNISTTISCI